MPYSSAYKRNQHFALLTKTSKHKILMSRFRHKNKPSTYLLFGKNKVRIAAHCPSAESENLGKP